MSKDKGYSSENFAMSYLDIIPATVMVVDDDLRILNYNKSTGEAFGLSKDVTLMQRNGEALNCVHSYETEEGCGYAEACKSCVIRNSVNQAMTEKTTRREQMKFSIKSGSSITDLDCLITAAPIVYENENRVVLVIEDIGELTALRRMIPICANCKKIRNDTDYWENVEDYLSSQMNINFSHGICPDCIKELYPQVADKILNKKSK